MNKLLMLAFLVVLMGLVATAAPQEEGVDNVDLEDAVESREVRDPGKKSSKNVEKADLEDFVESREVREAQRDFIPRRNRERKGQKNKNKKATRKGQKNKNKKATRKGQKNKSKKNKATRSG